jgi:integrase
MPTGIKTMPWVFYHRYWDRKKAEWSESPYRVRKTLMRTLCKRAGVTYFRFHALRHFGASVLDRANISFGSIQRISGHENRTTTEIYLHSIDEIDRAAMEYLGPKSKKSLTQILAQKKLRDCANRVTPWNNWWAVKESNLQPTD